MSAGEVAIHCLYLRHDTACNTDVLSMDERERAAAFRSVQSRKLFIAGRQLCRSVIARMTGQTASAIHIAINPAGKPYLPDYDIRFSLSHNANCLLLATSRHGDIGIDLEAVQNDRRDDLESVASLVLSDVELRAIAQLDGTERHDALLWAWVQKEAALKCWGQGFLVNATKVRIPLNECESHMTKQTGVARTTIQGGEFSDVYGNRYFWALAQACRNGIDGSRLRWNLSHLPP